MVLSWIFSVALLVKSIVYEKQVSYGCSLEFGYVNRVM